MFSAVALFAKTQRNRDERQAGGHGGHENGCKTLGGAPSDILAQILDAEGFAPAAYRMQNSVFWPRK